MSALVKDHLTWLDVLFLTLSGFGIGVLCSLSYASPPPKLVGLGCSGTSGPIFANNEDDFPLCSEIKEY